MLKRETFPDHSSSSHWYSGFKPRNDTPFLPSSNFNSNKATFNKNSNQAQPSFPPFFSSQMTFGNDSYTSESEPSTPLQSVSSSNVLFSKLPKSQVKNSIYKRKMIKHYMQNPKFPNWRSEKMNALKNLRTTRKDVMNVRRGSATKNVKFQGIKSFRDEGELQYFDLVYDRDIGFKQKWQHCFIEYVII